MQSFTFVKNVLSLMFSFDLGQFNGKTVFAAKISSVSDVQK